MVRESQSKRMRKSKPMTPRLIDRVARLAGNGCADQDGIAEVRVVVGEIILMVRTARCGPCENGVASPTCEPGGVTGVKIIVNDIVETSRQTAHEHVAPLSLGRLR